MKRQYGLPIDICSRTLGAINLETGEKDITYDAVHIRRAIVQPAREHRDFVYDLAYISANKDFTAGGFFDASDRRVIVDARDLPATWVVDENQFVIFDNRSYEIKSHRDFAQNMGYILVLRETKGQKIVRIMERNSVLTLQQTAVGVV